MPILLKIVNKSLNLLKLNIFDSNCLNLSESTTNNPILTLCQLDELAGILFDSVSNDASIGFVQPLSMEEAKDFWCDQILPLVEANNRALIIAESNGKIVGTVQLIISMPPNQQHRCEIAKMMVHSKQRKKGIGRLLMEAAITLAKSQNKTLITLDTRSGDVSQKLYELVGFKVAGSIPNFAKQTGGKGFCSTTYMFKEL